RDSARNSNGDLRVNFATGARRPSIPVMVNRLLVWVTLLFVLAPDCATQSRPQGDELVVLAGGTLIDGNGGPPITNAVVLVKGNRIVAAGRALKYPKSARVIDTTGKFILPGLIDIHVHYNDWMGELFLAHGVTTVKDLGNDVEWISTVSRQVEDGQVRG